jgi:hypothetical protein
MITKQDAMTHMEFWHITRTNADGTPMRVRKNGSCKTWKTRPDEFKLPVKYGIKDCFYIAHTRGDIDNTAEWCVPERWAIERYFRY